MCSGHTSLWNSSEFVTSVWLDSEAGCVLACPVLESQVSQAASCDREQKKQLFSAGLARCQ